MESFWTRTCCRSYFTHTPKHTTTTATTTLPLTGSCSSSFPLRTHAKRDETAGKMTRNPDDPEVLKLRAFLRQHNGLKGLEVCAPHEVERAAQLFHRDGFVAVSNVLTPEQLSLIRRGCQQALEKILAVDPTASFGGGAGGLAHRYC